MAFWSCPFKMLYVIVKKSLEYKKEVDDVMSLLTDELKRNCYKM